MRVPLAQYPGMNRFVLDWMNGDERFLQRSAATDRVGNELQAPAAARRAQPARPPELVNALRDSNQRWGLFVGEQLERWGRGETLTIVAGQQVGFAGGPLYTLAKLATLVRFKRDMESAGIPVTAFFWLATEDHDFDEVATLNVPVSTLPKEKDVNRQRDLLCMRAIRTADARAAVGSLPVPEALITQLLALYDLPRPGWLRQGITFRDSFAELIATAFGPEVILVDALLPELRQAGAPLLDEIWSRREEIQRVLQERARLLEAAGYREQVIARDGDEYTLLFELDGDGTRRPPTAGRQAERTSTSALTRPLLQDAVLQPDIFVGGPAEVAYYAQIAPLHQLLGIAMPRVALRGHVLVAPKRMARAIERYGLDPAALFRPADDVLAEKEPAGVARIRAITAEAKHDLLKHVHQIGDLALPADHSLAGSIQRTIGHLEYHFHKLSERAVKGLVRKDRERHAAVRDLVATLYPDAHVQERVVSWFSYWCRYGQLLLDRVIEEVEPDRAYFKVVSL